MKIERNYNIQSTFTPISKLQFTLHDKIDLAIYEIYATDEKPSSSFIEKGDEVA
ncbi:hypothetical protein [Fredinandcohnia onubensis]|uniref:hypothetical protein n=1 Tax=Fredinandcohnia onubensis TaxID=1571209 RepID=UPI0015D50045|nr:hypothetical protein [Fredinandcohnia onubensis]